MILPETEERRGEFAVALINPEYLTSIAALLATAFGVDIRLYGFDGRLIARDDGRGEAIGQILPGNWLFRDFLPRRELGSFTGLDAQRRMVSASFAVSRQVPIVVEVAESQRDVLEPVREQFQIFLIACIELQGCRFDVILMDMQMPVMDGLETTRNIRNGDSPNRTTRIIGLTAAVGPVYERQCMEAGMDDYLSKPVAKGALLNALGLTDSKEAGA
jgi:CheY-like chemotaxis protein